MLTVYAEIIFNGKPSILAIGWGARQREAASDQKSQHVLSPVFVEDNDPLAKLSGSLCFAWL
jgi:hypothetical protein